MNAHRVAQRLMHMLLPGRVTLTDDTGPVQTAQADFGPKGPDGSLRVFDKLPILGLFGFASRPPRTSEVLAIFFEGDPTKGAVIGHNHQPSRLKNLGEGDAALFDVRGAYVWLTPDGLVIDAATKHVRIQNADTVTVVASSKVRIEAPKAECTGDLVAKCDDASPISLTALHDAYNAHLHTGVQSGSSSTGATDHPA